MLKICIIIIFTQGLISAQSIKPNNFFVPENRKSFGHYLYCEKDYLRSVAELREFLKTESDDTLRFQIAKALQNLGKYSESADNFKTLFFSSLREEAKTEYFRSKYQTGNLSDFNFNTKINSYLPNNNLNQISQLTAVSMLLYEDGKIDSHQLMNEFPDSLKPPLKNFYLRKIDPGFKSPTSAAIMSAIIPGMGKIYADEVGDGITAFLAVGLLSFLAYDNFRADHDFRAWLFTGLAAYFYAGNIYGSAAAAQYYNAGIRFNFKNDVEVFINRQNLFLSDYDFWCR